MNVVHKLETYRKEAFSLKLLLPLPSDFPNYLQVTLELYLKRVMNFKLVCDEERKMLWNGPLSRDNVTKLMLHDARLQNDLSAPLRKLFEKFHAFFNALNRFASKKLGFN